MRTLTIKRVDGKIDVVDVSERYYNLNAKMIETLTKGIRAAGRGEVIAWESNHDEDALLNSESIQEMKRIVATYESGTCVKTKEALAAYIALQNEGGEGYAPELITKEHYENAKKAIK